MRGWLLAGVSVFGLALATGAAAQSNNCGQISICPPATTPLDGTEDLLGIQHGKTVQINVGSVATIATATAVQKANNGSDFASLTATLNNLSGLPHVANNAALNALPSTAYSAVVRDGFAVAGDAPQLAYVPSSSKCALAATTTPDGAVEVATSDGEFWCAVAPASGWDIREWGAKPDAVAGVSGTDNSGVFATAVGAFVYASNVASSSSGPTILIPAGIGCFYVGANTATTGKTGLQIVGAGLASNGSCITNYKTGSENFAIFSDLGTATAPTARQSIRGIIFFGSGKANTSNEAVLAHYSNGLHIDDNYFGGFYRPIEVEGQFISYIEDNHIDGAGATANDQCLYMGMPTDAADTLHNNSVVVSRNVCLLPTSGAHYGLRWENAQGSIFIGNQWLGGINGVYGCDPHSATNPDGSNAQCQFIYEDGDQADTQSAQNWLVKLGSAASLSYFQINNYWAGSGDGLATGPPPAVANLAGVDIEGASGAWQISGMSVSQDTGILLSGDSGGQVTVNCALYNAGNDGSPCAQVTNTTGVSVTGSGSALGGHSVGYNGVVESGTSAGNPLYGWGRANCVLGLKLGATAQTIVSGGCDYEVAGMKVRVQGYLELATKSGTGSITLTGLPYAAESTSISNGAFGNAGSWLCTQECASLTGPILVTANQGATTANLYQQAATGTASLADTNITPSGTHTILTGPIDYFKN